MALSDVLTQLINVLAALCPHTIMSLTICNSLSHITMCNTMAVCHNIHSSKEIQALSMSEEDNSQKVRIK